MVKCNSCSSDKVNKLLDVGKQPITNRFCKDSSGGNFSYPLVVNQCAVCGLLQINNPVPVKEVVPRFDWITYSEPEAHLDDLVNELSYLSGVTREVSLCGITFKDDSTLERFRNRGFKNIWRINKKKDLGINHPLAGLETIQECVNPKMTKELAKKHGLADIAIVRHILEHAYDINRFVRGIKELVKPQGYVVFEVPDCSQALENYDYTTLWEEHIIYFTEGTFKTTLVDNGFALIDFKSYPNAFENSLVAITRLANTNESNQVHGQALGKEIERAKRFSQNFFRYSQGLKDFLSKSRKKHGRIAIFGAGHLACTFINLFKLEEFIDFCIDDNPNKKGFYLAGTKLPIYDSRALSEKDVKLCLLTFNPINEDKIISRNNDFVNKGGMFLSIFPASKRAIHNFLNVNL